jgi:glucose-1-phosphate thymidylyltransferase
MSSDLLGVILAAGKGTRMMPFSERYPKPILPICGEPLMVHQIRAMKDLGVREVIIVIGHLGYEIVRALGDGDGLGVKLRYVEQEETLGIAHAVSRLEKHVSRPFFLFLGDIFFETENLGDMAQRLGRNGTAGVLAVKREKDPEAIKRNFIVITAPDGAVARVIEKPRHPRTDLKGCGLYLFDVAFFDAVRRTPRTAMRDEYEITDAIQIFIDDGYRVEAANVIKDDLNLSFPSDLLGLNLRALDHHGKDQFLGQGVEVHPGARIVHSVLMDGVKIRQPIEIRDSLVFPDQVIEKKNDLRRVILIPGHEIQCGMALEKSE